MAKKPNLTIAASGGTAVLSGDGPPRPLGSHGMNLWRSITAAYAIEDAGGRELLAGACIMLDRAEQLAEAIGRDGVVVVTRTGPKAHPALRDEIQCRAFITRTLARLGLEFEPLRSNVGRPPGVY